MIRSFPLRCLMFSILSVGVACTSVARQEHLDSKEARWASTEMRAPSDRVLWQLTLLTLRSQSFPLAAGSDMGSREVVSGWKTDMQPFKGEGERRRAAVRMTPIEAGLWKVEARVMVEHNENLVTPLDPARAEWKPFGDDDSGAQVLLQHIQSRLKPDLEVVPVGEPRG